MPAPKTALFIDGSEPLPKALDWQALVDEGEELLQALAGHVWTDFNAHDPGVTLLEALSYALTDLGYRAGQSIPDLLTDEQGRLDRHGACFYPPARIFPTAPVTVTDLRKVLLDELPNLANVWILPVSRQRAPGRSRVWLLPGPHADGDRLVRAAEQCLSRWRSLGEVVDGVDVVTPVPLALTLTLQVALDSEPEQLLQAAQAAVSRVLCPPMAFLPREGPGAPALSSEALYEGPLLSRGLLPDEDLWMPPEPGQLPSLVANALLSTEGVEEVSQLSIAPLDPASAPEDRPVVFRWEPLEAGNVIDLQRGGRKTRFEPGRVDRSRWPSPAPAPAQGLPVADAAAEWARQVPAGAFLDAGRYEPVQAQLPAIYGLEKDALPANAPPGRIAQVRQLRAYLFVFEQLLANAFAQLAELPRLLSWRTEASPYAWQPLYALEGAQALLVGAPAPEPGTGPRVGSEAWKSYQEDPGNPYATGVASAVEAWGRQYGHPEAILDHLLARFGESLPRFDWQNFETAEQKRRFLERYPELSANRALAFDVERARKLGRPVADNVSSLERKVGLLLAAGPRSPLEARGSAPMGDGEAEREEVAYRGRCYYLVEHPLFLPAAAAVPGTLPRLSEEARGAMRDTAQVPRSFFSARLSHVLTNWTFFPIHDGFQPYVEGFIRESAPAHLCNGFLWVSGPEMARFEELINRWYADGLPSLEVVGEGGDAQGREVLVARASGSAYALVQWLNGRPASQPGGST